MLFKYMYEVRQIEKIQTYSARAKEEPNMYRDQSDPVRNFEINCVYLD